jgi:two-component system OmpR family sensor kinase
VDALRVVSLQAPDQNAPSIVKYGRERSNKNLPEDGVRPSFHMEQSHNVAEESALAEIVFTYTKRYQCMHRSARVLYVDDESELQSEQTLADRFSVETTATTAAAFDRLENGSYDCVISAYDLPDNDGIEFLETVRESHPELPFILLVGDDHEEIVSDAIAAGVTDYVRKRTATEHLPNRVEMAIRQHRTRPESELFELGQEIADIGAWEVDLQTSDDGWTSGINQIYDLPEERELDSGEAIEYIHPDDRPTVEAAVYRAVYEGEPCDLEFRIQTGDGTRWIRGIYHPQTEDGETVSFSGVLLDITARKRRQMVLKALHRVATVIQTEQTVEQVYERITDAAVEILDFDLCVLLIREGEWLVPYNPSADTLPEGSRPLQLDEGIAGKTYRTGESYVVDDVQADDDATPASEAFRAVVSVPVGEHGVFQAVSNEAGEYDDTDLEFTELLVSHAASALDRIEHEQELKRQNERLEEFASIVSHDLRNPLNVAQLRLRLVREEFENEDIDSIARAHRRMERLIDDLLTLARAGTAVEETEAVSISGVTKAGWHNVETDGAHLATDLAGTIQANESRLQQLLENLIRNAVEHGTSDDETAGDEPDVTVTVGEIEDEGFYVEDDGPGIPEEEREKVFESGYTSQEVGTGFGLAIVEDVVEAHDWKIELSDSDDGGARFEITNVTFTSPEG